MWLRFHTGLRVAGQPDLLMKNSEGRIVVVDWKRSKTIRMENERAIMKPPLQHIAAANYWAYALQATCMYSVRLRVGARTRAAFAQGRHPKERR